MTSAASPPWPLSSAHITPAPGPPSPSPLPASRAHQKGRGWEGRARAGVGSAQTGSSQPVRLQRLLPCRWLSVWISSSANRSSCTTWRSSSQRAGQGLSAPSPSLLATPGPCSAAGNCPSPHQIPPPSLVRRCPACEGPGSVPKCGPTCCLLCCCHSSFLGSLDINNNTLSFLQHFI